MTIYIIDNNGKEFVANQDFDYEYSSNGEVNVTSSETYHKVVAFSSMLPASMVELPSGSLYKLLGYNPERMIPGVLPNHNDF